jgi:SAM-dependent MidA family methyltransferase
VTDHSNDLPTPAPDALEHSECLRRHIVTEIDRSGGWISFARYMELALYAPGLGYYGSGTRKFGVGGDFVTAPELTSLFGDTLATQVVELINRSAPRIIEIGAGSGALAADLLQELERRDALPERYDILELSGELRTRQHATLEERASRHLSRVVWLDRMPERVRGVVVANEVLDAMPVHLLVWRGGCIDERGVAVDAEGRLDWQDRPAQGRLREVALALPVAGTDKLPYVSELNLAARVWTASWAKVLECGALLLIDYGFPRCEYYHPQRCQGTLRCHYRHRAHDEPLYLPGLNDITAHVDFTAIAEAGCEAGLDLLGYTTQAQFLFNCGITDMLSRCSPTEPARYLPLASRVQKLISPAEMGELFKVMVLGRSIAPGLIGFARGDRSHTL